MCVQPMVTSWARRTEDLTFDKTDEKDAVLIARLTAQLRCYVPEPVDETWGRLRHLGARREQLPAETVSQVQQMRDLLECVWPAVLDTARQPFRSPTWSGAMTVILDRDGGDLARTRRLGLARFEAAVRREVTRCGGQKPCLRIVRQLFTALADPAGVIAHRPGALERAHPAETDWQESQPPLADTETRMTVLDELQLTSLVTSITGLSAVGAAAILAETGNLRRFATGRALVKHAGLAPREKLPAPTPAAPRSPARAGPAFGSRPGGRSGEPSAPTRSTLPDTAPDHPRAEQAHPHPGPGRDRRGAPPPAARRHHHRPGLGPRHRHARHPAAKRSASPPDIRRPSSSGRGEPHAASRHHGYLDGHHGQPRPSSTSTRLHAAGTNPITAMQGQTTDEAPAKRLTQTALR